MSMKVVVCVIGYGGWYPRGVARLIDRMNAVCPGIDVMGWANTLPFAAPFAVVENGWDYTGYCAKPFALMEAKIASADIAILVDAAFYPIRPINPLIDYIAQNGYFFCRNGYNVGEWSSDRALDRMGLGRDEAMTIEEISSYCVGLNFAHGQCNELLWRWCGYAADRLTFPGPHTNYGQGGGRNPGNCSLDPRCRGHRHDQTALSIIAHRLGMRELVNRPRFTSYLGYETQETVLVNHGGF